MLKGLCILTSCSHSVDIAFKMQTLLSGLVDLIDNTKGQSSEEQYTGKLAHIGYDCICFGKCNYIFGDLEFKQA